MTFTLGVQNLQQTDNARDELATINAVAKRAHLVTWNEARDAKAHLDQLANFDSVVVGGLGLSWRPEKFTKIQSGYSTVMLGGNVGADGARGPDRDNRRVGPSRGCLWAVLRETETSKLVIIATHHSVARADTSAKWRRGLRLGGWRGVVRTLKPVQARYPTAALILTGDWNTVGAVTTFLELGVREAKTPATFGRKLRYDRIHGDVTNVGSLVTRSDHLALLASVTLTGDPDATVVPNVAPTPRMMPRRPIPRPWRRRTRRWKRRHPRLWRRIVAWRRNNPRKKV